MFEFRASYFEQGYHKAGDLPFKFPPQGIESQLDSNLIEIRGLNGTGKTTLLNILALALGYLEREQELEKKPLLRNKLQVLNDNETLEYSFRITRPQPSPIDLRLERSKGERPRAYFDSKAIGPETLARDFDVVFLTEDDPGKVIEASLGKLSRYFKDLDNRLKSVVEVLTKHAIENHEFQEFRKTEAGMLKEIEGHTDSVNKNKQQLETLGSKLKQIQSRDSIRSKLELLNSKEAIEIEYRNLQQKHDQLAGKKDSDIRERIFREQLRYEREQGLLREISSRIVQICDSLAQYGIKLSTERILKDDYTEFNVVKSASQGQSRTDTSRAEIVDDMIRLLEKYSIDTIVPVFEKRVEDVRMDFYKARAKMSSDRARALLEALGRALTERTEALIRLDRIEGKIGELSQNRRDLEGIEEIAKDFFEAERKYIALQTVLQEDKKTLLSKWNEVKLYEGDAISLSSDIQRNEAQVRADEAIRSRTEQKLSLLRENASKKPKYFELEKRLESERASISGLREKLFQWVQILPDPSASRQQFESMKGQPGFGLEDYKRFVEAVGHFLGDQFEPVLFDNKLHGIKFLNIETRTFTTEDSRHIPIRNLSQGQSKITTITGSFKQMEHDKLKIVLVDEIADLDPENLKNVKKILAEKFEAGSLLLAILVRPPHESSGNLVEVVGWD